MRFINVDFVLFCAYDINVSDIRRDSMKFFLFVFILVFLPMVSWAEAVSVKNPQMTEITMTTTQAMQLAGALVDKGDFEHAQQILTMTPKMGNVALEIERWFLLAQIAQKQGDYNSAIKIYQKILDDQPDLARIRFELATCYMYTKKWYRADYHLRLAMAGADLPEEVRKIMNYYRYIVRQNKNWNVWFNIGVAPDNNVNNASGGTEIYNTEWGVFSRHLDDPERAVGTNFTLGGNYEFKLSEHWRWKSDAYIYSNIYDIHDYDDLYLSLGSGPRYIWNRGDVWLAAVWNRRWYSWDRYNWSVGAKLDLNYDFTRKLSGGLYLQYLNNTYDLYDDFLSGNTYSSQLRFSYSFNASIYSMLRIGLSREDARVPAYSYWQPGFGIGVGAELPLGFHIYAEPYFYWTSYDGGRWLVYNGDYTQVTERDFSQRYSVSLSNNKFDIWGFVPTVMLSYTKRDSNIWQREFDKFTAEFTMRQRF